MGNESQGKLVVQRCWSNFWFVKSFLPEGEIWVHNNVIVEKYYWIIMIDDSDLTFRQIEFCSKIVIDENLLAVLVIC